jgi:hypothetical protein
MEEKLVIWIPYGSILIMWAPYHEVRNNYTFQVAFFHHREWANAKFNLKTMLINFSS